jgi:hypothetical protein
LIFSSSRLPASANSLLGASMSIPPIVALGPLQVLRNIGILSRKGERMPWGAAQKGTNCHDEMAKGISKNARQTLAPHSNLSGDPFMLFDYQFERSDGASKRQALANTMKVRRELVHHHVPT